MGFFNIRTVPFYVASTFLDFQVERNILRDEVVFPLNKLYGEELVNVKGIDLRWGILPSDSEDEHEEKVLKVCTQQIKRTNSNVILFLGDRYGWVPANKKIAPYLKGLNLPPLERISITALEIIYALNNRSKDSKIFIYMRNLVNYDELDEPTKKLFDEDNKDLKTLKEYLINNYPELIRTYDVMWDKSKNQIVKPDSLKNQLSNDIENILIQYQTPYKEQQIVEHHLQKTLHHYVERKYLENEVLRKLKDPSHRGVLISNAYCDGTSTIIAAAVRTLRKTEKSVFYYSEDMKLDRAANIGELLQKPSRIRKPRDFQEAEGYFLNYMYIMNLHSPIETVLFLKLNPNYERVVVLLRNAIKEFIKSKKHRHFICEDSKTSWVHFLSTVGNIQFLTSREMDVQQHIMLTKTFQKSDATALLKNLADDSSKEISDKLIQLLLAKETTPKVRVATDLSVAYEFMNNANKYPDTRYSYEEAEWIKKAFHLLEAQTKFDKIEDYAKSLSGNLKELNKYYIQLLIINLGETYTKFALSYIGFFKSKVSLDFIKTLLSYTLPDQATELKFAELQNLLKDFCNFNDQGVHFNNDKTKSLIFDFMRENVMHSKCLPHMISFYEKQSPDSYGSRDWLYLEEQLANLLIEELSINLIPEKQLEYVMLYKRILAEHVGITDKNLSTYEELIASQKGKWKDTDYERMRSYLSIPNHMQQDFKSNYLNWSNQFCENGEKMLQAFQAYSFIENTIKNDGKHKPLYNPKDEKMIKEFEFFKSLLAYRSQVHRFID